MNTALAEAQRSGAPWPRAMRPRRRGRAALAYLAGRMPRREVAVPSSPGRAGCWVSRRDTAWRASGTGSRPGAPRWRSCTTSARPALRARAGARAERPARRRQAAGPRARRGRAAAAARRSTSGWPLWSPVAGPACAPELQEVLRLGAYQLTALDRVPAHAAVDTSVALAKEAGGAKAGGFVNAVLRRVGRRRPDRRGRSRGYGCDGARTAGRADRGTSRGRGVAPALARGTLARAFRSGGDRGAASLEQHPPPARAAAARESRRLSSSGAGKLRESASAPRRSVRD